MKFVYKGLLPIFIGMALVSCAGTESSEQTKVEDNPNLFKAGTPFADSLASTMPEFARSVFKGTLDSVPGEYYYHATNDKIDTLFQKEGEQYKPVVSIDYYSPNEQSNYDLKKGDCVYTVKDDALEGEICFPKYVNMFWNNGKPKTVMTGILYKGEQGDIRVDSGHSEIYFENGKIYQQNEWRDKQPVAGKQWNENGVITVELDFPKSFKDYWDDGKPKNISAGLLFRDNQGVFRVDSGYSEIYFENGKINEQNNWKDKQLVASKVWNKNGVLVADMDFRNSCIEYWDNGKIKQKNEGLLYREDGYNGKNICAMDSGRSELYFENGAIKQQNDWKSKQPIASKQWNENGILVVEVDFPKYSKTYWDNGKPKNIMTGLLYRLNQGDIRMDSGHSELYFENGKIRQQADWKDKQPVALKQWNENGVLTRELDYPKFLKESWDDGKTKVLMTGLLYRDDQGVFRVDSGHSEVYFENGKINEKNDWKDKQLVTSKVWDENGVLTKELVFPKSFKEYWNSRKTKVLMTGLLYRDEQDYPHVDSGHSESYFENGKKQHQGEWKNKQIITLKEWNENGVLIKEVDISKYYKEYWDTGTPKNILSGMIYRDDQGNFQMDSGHIESFFESGKIKGHFDWKDKQLAAGKQWNESGALSVEIIDAQTGHVKIYHENGVIQIEVTGFNGFNGITFDRMAEGFNGLDKGGFAIENGHINAYYDNGKPTAQIQYKDKKLISIKSWHEDGTLSAEGDVSKEFYKVFFPNGKLSREISGKFYFDSDYDIILENGSYKKRHENGKLAEQKIYKEKELVNKTVWNEKGIVTISAELPNRYREFYDDGKIKAQATGTIIAEDDSFKIKDGTYNEYDQNGKITYSATFKDFQKILER